MLDSTLPLRDIAVALLPGLRIFGFTFLRAFLFKVLLQDAPYQFSPHRPSTLEYDFVVVGAGTAGSVVAARLAERGAEVLVLEAGGSAPPETSVPGFMGMTLGGDMDYHIKLKPQANTQQAYLGNSSYIALGRTVGGSASINGMVYTRGDPRDFDNWAQLGNPGWGYEDVLPYFRKLEDFGGQPPPYAGSNLGKGGPFRVQYVDFDSKVSKLFLKAGVELGYKIVDDNGRNRIGFTPMMFAVRDGRRETSSEAYLRPNAHRANLRVLPGARADKIIFNKNKKATGVEFTLNRKKHFVRARKEVIVSSGAINSPKLLLLSGVGPEEHLRKVGVHVVADVPGVGRNLHDHPSLLQVAFSVNEGASFSLERFTNPNNIIQYFKHRKGPYANPFGLQGCAFLSLEDESSSWPDLQLILVTVSLSNFGEVAARATIGITGEAYASTVAPLEGKEMIVLSPGLIRPHSRGLLTLRSSNPRDDPVVDFNYFSDQADLALMVKGIRFAQRVANTTTLQGIGATWRSKPVPTCSSHPPDSDSYWACFARYFINTGYHPAGTCKMAPDSDPLGVVSHKLRLRGVSGVRVVDNSVMPTIVTANSMASALMIGERAADIILEDWGYLALG